MSIIYCLVTAVPLMTQGATVFTGIRSVAVGVLSVLAVAHAVVAENSLPEEREVTAQADDKDVAADVGRLLKLLKQQQDNQMAGDDHWAETMKELIELGPRAVPALVIALRETPIDERHMLRSIPFVLRGIGDPRAVPVLIQTLPKCNSVDGSDMGYAAKDPKLLAFMRKHDHDLKDQRPDGYTWGRPINEVRTALNLLTGVEHGEVELVHVHSGKGTPRQQLLREHAWHRCASRWARWWEDHGNEFTDDPAYSSVVLPDPTAFPAGEFALDRHVSLTVSHSSSGHACEPYQTGGGRVFYDLDIGRYGALHPRWEAMKDRTNNAIIRKWGFSEGFDLMGRQVEVNGRSVFVLEVIAGEVWHVPMSVLKQGEFANAMEIIDQGEMVDGILAPNGDNTYQNNDAYFIITRHGTPILLRQGVEVHDTNVKIGSPSRGDANMNPVGHFKGRRFSLRFLAAKP